MKACVLQGIGDLRYEEVALPQPGHGEVLVRIHACGICGSDIPRIFTKGAYRFPLIPGHEFAGVVEALGTDVSADWLGARVTVFPLLPCFNCESCRQGRYAQCSHYNYFGSRCDGGFAEYIAVPLWNLVRLPDSLALDAAAMTEPAAVACHAVGQAGIYPGDTVLIAGAGTIGLMAALWCRALGASRVILSDVVQVNLDFAGSQGFPWRINSVCQDPAAYIRDLTGREGADVCIDCAGVPAAVEHCFAAAKPQGRVVLMGNPSGDMTIGQHTYWHILRKELRVSGTWNSSYGGLSNDWTRSIEAIAAGQLDISALITHRFPLADADKALEIMRSRDRLSIKVMFINEEPGSEQ